MRYRNISWTAAEYKALVRLSETFDIPELKSLLAKMERAKLPKTPKVRQEFVVGDIKAVARDVLRSRLKSNPKETDAWYGKMNRYIRDNDITPSLMRQAAMKAKRDWKGAIFFDTLLYSVTKLVALDVPAGQRTEQFTGFADTIEYGLHETPPGE